MITLSEQISENSNQILNVVSSLHKINNHVVQSIVSHQLEGIEGLISTSTRQLQELSQVKTAEEAIAAQFQIVNEMGALIADQTKETIAVVSEGHDQVETLVTTEMQSMLEKAKTITV